MGSSGINAPHKGAYKHCFLTSTNSSGIMMGFPRYQQAENPTRFMHISEIVQECRLWAQQQCKRHAPHDSSGSRSPPVWFSLNFGEDEPHCGAAVAKELLRAWGAIDAGAIQTHEECLFETAEQWHQTFAVLKTLLSETLLS